MPPPPPQPRAPPPQLPDELVEEILVRIPLDDPATLVRAALACRRWCRLVADPDFRRRRLDLHRAAATPPPMLGVLCNSSYYEESSCSRFVPTSSLRPPRAAVNPGLCAFDARHGRVLLQRLLSDSDLVVWDPITDQQLEVPSPPSSVGNGGTKATVLCAATATGAICSHVDCHRGPFIVVLVGTNVDVYDPWDSDNHYDDMNHHFYDEVSRPKDMFSCVYSSESGAWSEPVFADNTDHGVDYWACSALVGNALFVSLDRSYTIIKYDLGTQQMSLMSLPYLRTDMTCNDLFVDTELTTLEDGRLGLARVEKSSELCLWSRGGEGDDVEGWTLCKVIDLKDLFPLADSITLKHCLVGFAEGVCVAFVAVEGALFTIDMKSGLMERLSEGPGICFAVPYIHFCTPALEATSRDDGQRVGISCGKGGSSSA